ncbi:hypothetical protein KXX34_001982 [Aspergillus fumigatus]|nr:hypothetical protein KXX34_001982 [Aspergillus fumigatus]
MLTSAILVPSLLTAVPASSASSLLRYDATLDKGRIECVYPISGQYALLQRVLYYSLLLFSIVSRKAPWLVAGALGAAMTYAGSAAVHATILAGISRDSLLDLDCLGIFAIVSVGSLVVTVFFPWVGTAATEPILLTSAAQSGLVPFNCTYACFSTRQAFRDPGDIRVVPAGTVSTQRFRLLEVSIWLSRFLGAVVSLYRLLVTPRYYTKAELEGILRAADKTLSRGDVLPKKAPPRKADAIHGPEEVGSRAEADGIPTSEPPNAVGQWGPWVAVIMALAGSALVEYHRPAWEEWQRVLREEGVLVKAEKNPSLVPSLWMRLSNVGGKSPATESGPSRSSLAKGIA